jgi:hypothetical protein
MGMRLRWVLLQEKKIAKKETEKSRKEVRKRQNKIKI